MEKQNFRSKIIKNFIFGNFATILNKLGSMFFLVILARILEPELFGVYSLTMSIAMSLIFLTDSGAFGGIVKNVAKYAGQGDYETARSYVRYIIKIKLVLALLFSGLLFLLSNTLSTVIFKDINLLIPIRVASLFIILFGFIEFVTSIFYGMQNFYYAAFKEIILQVSRLIFLFGIFFLFGITITNAIIAFILSALLTSFVLSFIILRKFKPLIIGKIHKINRRDLISYLAYFSFGSLSLLIFNYTDILIIGYFLPLEFVGYYSPALSIILGISTMISVQFLFFPMFAEVSKEKLERLFNAAVRWVALVNIPAIFGLIILRREVIVLLLGSEYLPAVLPLTILSFLLFEVGISSLLSSLFYAGDKPKHPAYLMIISSILNVILNLILIMNLIKIKPIYGLMGAAFATTISRYINLILLTIYAKEKLNVSLHINKLYKPLIASIVMFITLSFLPLKTGYIGAIITIIAGVIIYVTVMLIIKGIRLTELFQLKTTILDFRIKKER